VEHSIVGVRSRIEDGVTLKDTMMLGADYYEMELEIAALCTEGKLPVGIGKNSKISNCIVDKNARIGNDVVIRNTDVCFLDSQHFYQLPLVSPGFFMYQM
jgi:glucose-1-phosphate adenylyltransferase